jgi:hypothetical protein
MLPKDTQIFVSFHPDEESLVLPVLEQAKAAGWSGINKTDAQTNQTAVMDTIQKCGLVLVFLSKAYAHDEQLMLERFAYAATVARRPYIPVWLESFADIQRCYQNGEGDQQLLSAFEMLTAKYPGTTAEKLIAALEQFTAENISYTPSAPQICEKPSEAYEGDEPFIFISYAHDDANRVYPIIKELYESGWDLWYDEGIKTTERYLPVISYHVKRCSVVVLMLTNRCLNRPFVMNYELEYARQRGIKVIPVLLEELNPQPWSKANVDQLMKTAITPDKLLNRIGAVGLVNRGKRKAVPPAIKQNVIYDIVLPPELPGLNFSIQGEEIKIIRYTGNDTDVVIPGTVTSPDGSVTFKVTVIDDYAFAGGGLLLRFDIPDSKKETDKKAFNKCNLIKNITIPDNVTSIGKGAFLGCKSLRNVTIPDSVTDIGEKAFYYCKSLVSVNIPKNVSSINDHTFDGCGMLTDIVIPDGVTSIGNRAFNYCKSLVNVVIPESVTEIEDNAFWGCKSLKEIILPKKIKEIGEGAFLLCPQLGEIFDPDKTTIFRGPENWDSSIPYCIPDGVTKINGGAFSGYKVNFLTRIIFKLPPDEYRQPESIVIPDSVTEINDKAFAGGRNLKKVFIPDSVKKIGEKAFESCLSLENINIPNGVTSIGENAFQYCIALKSINIPDSVTSIGKNAFYGCKSLKNVIMPDSVTHIGDKAFKGTPFENNLPVRKLPDNDNKMELTKEFAGWGPIEHEDNQKKPEQFKIPVCRETPRAKVCCATFDAQHVSALLTELYWEGFNIFYNKSSNLREIEESQCILAFISNKTAESTQAMNILKAAVLHDVSKIIQVFIGDCTELPVEIRDKLHDRQAVIRKNLSEQEFTGKIRDSLRQFGCNLGRPRGFEIKKTGNAVEIVKFYPTDFSQVVIPKTFLNPPLPVTGIGAAAFMECDTLTSVTIPDSVKSIGEKAFSACKSLKSVNIPHGVVNIGKAAFENCESLSSVNIPYGITQIAENTFYGCEALNHFIIPDSVKYIEDSAFLSCGFLKNVIIPKSVISIGENAFYSWPINEEVTIPDNVKKIHWSLCFYYKEINIISAKTNIIKKNIPGLEDYDDFEHLTIHTVPGGKAWKFAKENNIKCVPLE